VFAVPASPSATPTGVFTKTATSSATNQKIEDLKERLATKVAELQQSQRQAIYGTVKTVSISTLTVETEKKDIKIELTDDLKVFQNLKGKRTELKGEDIAKGDVVTMFGNYDTAIEVLKAKVIFIQSQTDVQFVIGTIKETSKKDYTITVEQKNGKSMLIDFETTTKTSVWNNNAVEKGGFSKLIVGDMVMIAGTPVPKKENRISALRITTFGNPSGVPQAVGSTLTPTEEKTTTPSGTPKATPTTKQ